MNIHIKTLILSNFRNYSYAHLEVDIRPVVLVGANGAGKTNILEAISLLTPGRGLRRASVSELDNLHNGKPWALHAEIEGLKGPANIGTGRECNGNDKRIVKIDEKTARSHTDLARIFSVLWLTPQMDTLFIEGNSERRKFLDRLVFSFDGAHATRVNAYESVMRERNRLLQMGQTDPVWLTALEKKMAEQGIAIAVARQNAAEQLNNAMNIPTHVFPKAHIVLSGAVEELLTQNSALATENGFRDSLKSSRAQDAAAGRALTGVHRTKIDVIHKEKNLPAEFCSTGEQKALLVSIVLAQAQAGALWHGNVPVMLLDEVATHLDGTRREALFTELQALGAQCWLTGTDHDVFEGLDAQVLAVDHGSIQAELFA